MKRFFICLSCAIAMASVTSCYDDSELRSTLQDYEKRLAAVEQLCKEMNNNISSLQSLMEALQNNDYVTGVSPVKQGTETVGYTISFTISDPITIYHGTDGKDGVDGSNGKDGSTPIIGVALSEDGIYCWTLDGSWLLDGDGNEIPATGRNGKDGITPQLKIEDGYWYISYDNGATWTQLDKATGEDGNDGKDGTEIFKDFSQDDNNIYLTLSDGTEITVPKAQNKSIQAISFLPEYENGYAYVKIKEDSKRLDATLQIMPSEYAAILVENFNSGKKDFLCANVLPVQQTKAAQIPVTLPLSSLSLLADGVVDASFDASTIDVDALLIGIQSYMCSFYARYEDVIVSSSYVQMIKDGGVYLSEYGTANCYIVDKAGYYIFMAAKGNTKESIGKGASAEVLWESFGTDETPNVGDIINDVNYVDLDDGYVQFSTPSSLNNGNAVIAVKDASGEILWSWHIWVCEGYDADASGQEYNNYAGIMMDRNLGATSATPGDVHALGLLYQWGRKDPFLGGNSISHSTSYYQSKATSSISWPSTVASDSSTGTIEYAVAHPTTFITYNPGNNDWYYTEDGSTEDFRWNFSKTIYDPCPAGWKVPEGGDYSGVWAKAFGTNTK